MAKRTDAAYPTLSLRVPPTLLAALDAHGGKQSATVRKAILLYLRVTTHGVGGLEEALERIEAGAGLVGTTDLLLDALDVGGADVD